MSNKDEPGSEPAVLSELTRRVEGLERENQSLKSAAKPSFWNSPAAGLMQILIGGIIAGALTFQYLLDITAKLDELEARRAEAEEKIQALAADEATLRTRRDQLDAETAQRASEKENLQRDNAKLLERSKALEAEIAELEKKQAEGVQPEAIAALLEDAKARASELTAQAEERVESLDNFENSYFAVIASVYEGDDIAYSYRVLQGSFPDYELHIYRTSDRDGKALYAVTLGGAQSADEAQKRVRVARANGREGAYRWQSLNWKTNVAGQFVANN